MSHLYPLTGVYAISDGSKFPIISSKLRESLEGGTSIVQYRSKSRNQKKCLSESLALLELCQQYQVPLIINDDVGLAKKINATGVHLGQNDCSLSSARSILGEKAIIGISCYNQLDLALLAEQQGASYVAFGSMFASPTKPEAPRASIELLIEAKKQLSVPICCIGGITLENASQLIEAGTDMIAVISALFASDDIKQTSQNFTQLFTTNK